MSAFSRVLAAFSPGFLLKAGLTWSANNPRCAGARELKRGTVVGPAGALLGVDYRSQTRRVARDEVINNRRDAEQRLFI